jgi:hypothetical protein
MARSPVTLANQPLTWLSLAALAFATLSHEGRGMTKQITVNL